MKRKREIEENKKYNEEEHMKAEEKSTRRKRNLLHLFSVSDWPLFRLV